MAALERYFLSKGYAVAGYDRTPSELTGHLQQEGAVIAFDDDVEKAVPQAFRNPADTLVVYTPAVPEDTAVMTYFRQGGFEMIKRAALLGKITRESKGLCFAGTHGKTTTSSMAAHIMHNCPAGCNAFLGGVLRNYDSNFLLAPASPYAIIEADEFDRSFLQLHPQAAVITSVDPDHLDIYGTYEAVREAFAQFAGQITPGGTLILKKGIELPLERADIRRYTYHVTDSGADFHAENLRVDGGGYYTFDLVFPDRRIERCRLGIPGLVNVENCVAAAALVWSEGFVSDERMREAIATFRGVQRRFDFWVNDPSVAGGTIYMDDYAHHPAERCCLRCGRCFRNGS